MKKAIEYQEHAQQCRDLARTAPNQGHRAMLLGMAETWDSLAKQREITVARKKRIEKLEVDNPTPSEK